MPIIVHSRNAENDTYDILKMKNKNLKFKSLNSLLYRNKRFAKKIVDIGFYISVSGIITFKNSSGKCSYNYSYG